MKRLLSILETENINYLHKLQDIFIMNYNEICRVYNNVNNDELVSQTAYEFEIYDDFYYQLFHHYSVTNSEDNYD